MSVTAQAVESLYDADFAAWAGGSAELLRQGADLSEVQRIKIAEELESMAGATRRQLKNRTIALLMHLLKMKYQPEKRTRSWDFTVSEQRGQIEDLLTESPSLNAYFTEEFPSFYRRARKLAKIETGLDVFPDVLPFSMDEILNDSE